MCDVQGYSLDMNGSHYEVFQHEMNQHVTVDAEDLILLQSTGLLDCKGSEIFEGDIVDIRGGFWSGCGFSATLDTYCEAKEVVRWDHCGWEPFLRMNGEAGITVIGNIYMNPDLLAPERKEGGRVSDIASQITKRILGQRPPKFTVNIAEHEVRPFAEYLAGIMRFGVNGAPSVASIERLRALTGCGREDI